MPAQSVSARRSPGPAPEPEHTPAAALGEGGERLQQAPRRAWKGCLSFAGMVLELAQGRRLGLSALPPPGPHSPAHLMLEQGAPSALPGHNPYYYNL